MTNLPNEILREYDIRGTFGKNLTSEIAFSIGERFGSYLQQNNYGNTVAVGFDGRESSPILVQHLIDGLISVGIKVSNIGLGPTPMLYFAIHHLNASAGIMVTGSHNPAMDNGFKIALKDRPFFGIDIKNLQNVIINKTFGGSYENISVFNHYIERLLKDYNSTSKQLNIAWDCGNGATGNVIETLVTRLSCKSTTLHTKIDGTFPNHHPDPSVKENLNDIIDCIVKNNCDAGIAFDGDGDRIGVVDRLGRILWGDQLVILFARDVLKNNPGATIIADVKASKTTFDDICAYGGKAVMAATGHSLIKTKMKQEKAIFAGEMSGHIFFADHYYGFDDAIYAAIRLLNILGSNDNDFDLEHFIDTLPKVVNTPEIRITCPDDEKFLKVEQVKQTLIENEIHFCDVDGVRVNINNGWWLLRASNTQPALIIRMEAQTKEDLEQIKSSFKDITSIDFMAEAL